MPTINSERTVRTLISTGKSAGRKIWRYEDLWGSTQFFQARVKIDEVGFLRANYRSELLYDRAARYVHPDFAPAVFTSKNKVKKKR